MVCGAVVFFVSGPCSLVSHVRRGLESTCLAIQEQPPQELGAHAAKLVGCVGLMLENPLGVRVAVPAAAAEAFVVQDEERLVKELASWFGAQVSSGQPWSPNLLNMKPSCSFENGTGGKQCLVCTGHATRCATASISKGSCSTGLSFPPVAWDLGAALCSAHPDCIALAFNSESSYGLQEISPASLRPVIAGDSLYIACAELVPSDSTLVVPQQGSSMQGIAPMDRNHGSASDVTGMHWLDCIGSEFDVRWSTFYQLLMQQSVENLLYDPVSSQMVELALQLSSSVLEVQLALDVEFALEVDQLALVLFSRAELFGSVLNGTQSPEALDGFCFGGVVNALVVALRAVHSRESLGGGLMTEEALGLLALVRGSLGSRLNYDFLACCSRWTFVTGMDLIDLIEQERQHNLLDISPQSAAIDALAVLQNAPTPPQHWQPLRRKSLHVCVFGLFHFGTLENAVTLLQAALSSVPSATMHVIHNKLGIRDSYFEEMSGAGSGVHYLEEWCALLNCTLDVTPWNEIFRLVDARYESRTVPLLSADLFDLAREVRGLVEVDRRCDLVVSANMDLVYMALLSQAFPAAKLLYFATDSVLPHDAGHEMLYLRLLSEELFFRPTSRGRMVVSCEKLQVQTFYQLGAWPHLVLSVSMGHLQGRHAPGESRKRSVLVYGRPALKLTPLRGVLEAFVTVNAQMAFEFQFGEDALPYSTWGGYSACVFLPWNLHAVSFLEFVSLDVPLLVPAGAFAYTITKVVHTGFRQDASVYYTNDAGLWRNRTLAMPSPFWSIDGPMRHQFLFWYELSHMRRRPGALSFNTLYELLALLGDEPALSRSLSLMRQAYVEAAVQSVRTVSGMLHELFHGAGDEKEW